MVDNIYVKPSADVKRVSVATDLVNGVHYPVYKQAFGLSGEVPKPVSSFNPLPITIVGSESTQFGEVKTAARTPLIELNSSYGQSLIRDVVTLAGTGTVTDGAGEIIISTGATASSSSLMRSAEIGRYVPGYAAEVGIGMRFPAAPTGEQVAEWGGRSADGTNGFIWGYDVTGLYIARLDGGVIKDKTYQADWNLDKMDGTGKSGINLDMADGNIFQINFTWYGYGQIVWQLVTTVNGLQAPRSVHQLKVLGEPSIEDPNLAVFAEVSNGATTSNFTADVGGRQYSIIGEYRPAYRFAGEYRAPVATSTTAVPTITFKAKTGFLSRAIKVDMTDVIPASQDVIVEIRINGSLTGAVYATPTNHNANETACEVDVAATAITGGVVVWSNYFASGTGNRGLLAEALVSLTIPAGQPVTLCVRTPTGTGTCAAFFRVREEW
jgi:hypothetical protein